MTKQEKIEIHVEKIIDYLNSVYGKKELKKAIKF